MSNPKYTIDDWLFEPSADRLTRNGRSISLESKCAGVLLELCEHAGEVVSHDELLDSVWGGRSVSLQSVPVVISKLRSILGDSSQQPKYIETISKRGYRLIASVQPVQLTRKEQVLAEESTTGSQSRHQNKGRVLRLAPVIIGIVAVAVATVIYFQRQAPTGVNSQTQAGASQDAPLSEADMMVARAIDLWDFRGRANNIAAFQLAQQALDQDPDHARGNALMAIIYTRYDGTYLEIGDVDTVALARAHMDRAYAQAPGDPYVLTAMARQRITLDWRPDQALDYLEQIPLNHPRSANSMVSRAVAYYMLGRMEESLEAYHLSVELALNVPYARLLGIMILNGAGRHNEAISLARALPDGFLDTFGLYLASSHHALADYPAAYDELVNLLQSMDIELSDPQLGRDLLLADEEEAAFGWLAQQVGDRLLDQRYMSLYAILLSFSGEREQLITFLGELPRNRDTNFLNAIHQWSAFFNLRNDVEFQGLLRSIGVAPLARCVHAACGETVALR